MAKIFRIGGIAIDNVLTETPSYTTSVTSLAMEKRGDVTDHSNNENPTVSMTGIVSDLPSLDVEAERDGTATPSEQVRLALLALRATKQPFTYIGLLDTYESVLFTQLDFPKDESTGAALMITASFKSVNTVNLERVGAIAKKNRGFRPSKKIDGRVMWLCPPGKLPTISESINYQQSCRKVVMRNEVWVFADNGQPLQLVDWGTMRLQNSGLAPKETGLAATTSEITVRGHTNIQPDFTTSLPLSAVNGPITFSPGAPALRTMSTTRPPKAGS